MKRAININILGEKHAICQSAFFRNNSGLFRCSIYDALAEGGKCVRMGMGKFVRKCVTTEIAKNRLK
jgi:hypothetical protein